MSGVRRLFLLVSNHVQSRMQQPLPLMSTPSIRKVRPSEEATCYEPWGCLHTLHTNNLHVKQVSPSLCAFQTSLTSQCSTSWQFWWKYSCRWVRFDSLTIGKDSPGGVKNTPGNFNHPNWTPHQIINHESRRNKPFTSRQKGGLAFLLGWNQCARRERRERRKFD